MCVCIYVFHSSRLRRGFLAEKFFLIVDVMVVLAVNPKHNIIHILGNMQCKCGKLSSPSKVSTEVVSSRHKRRVIVLKTTKYANNLPHFCTDFVFTENFRGTSLFFFFCKFAYYIYGCIYYSVTLAL